MGQKVPEYLKALIDNGIDPDEAMKFANTDDIGGLEGSMVPDLKAVRETMKKLEEDKQRGFVGEMRANQ